MKGILVLRLKFFNVMYSIAPLNEKAWYPKLWLRK